MDVPFFAERGAEPYFLLSQGLPRVDDRQIVSGIIYVIKHGLIWRDAPRDYGPHKTIYNRFRITQFSSSSSWARHAASVAA